MGEGRRYAIENYLLDPLLIAAALINEKPAYAAEMGIQTATFANISSFSAAEFQMMSNAVQSALAKRIGNTHSGVREAARYLGDFEIEIDHELLVINGHDLEERVLETYPVLKRHSGTGKLLRYMIDVVIRNHPSMTPSELIDSLTALCNAEL